MLGSAQFALGTFLVPMEEELGWSRSVFFGALSTRFLLAGLLGPLIGPMSDSVRAPRFVLPAGVVVMSGSLAAVRWIDNPVWFFAIYGVAGAVGTATLALTTWDAIILKWFSRRRTRALVVGSMGEAAGPLVFPLLITALVALFGWRDAWLWFGALTFVTLMPFALAVRTRPEQVGQHVDGDDAVELPKADVDAASTTRNEQDFTRTEAVGSSSFWLLAAAFTVSGVAITGFQAQWIPLFRDDGFSAGVAAAAVSAYGLSNIASRLVWAGLTVRFSLRTLMAAHAVAAGAGVLYLLLVVSNTPTLFVWAAYQGMVLGSFFPLHALLMTEYFGRPNIGAIRGVIQPIASLSRSGGALMLGAMRDWRGSYDLALLVVIGGWAAMAGLLSAARRPVKPNVGGLGEAREAERSGDGV